MDEPRRSHSEVLSQKLLKLQSKLSAKASPDGRFKSFIKRYWKFVLVYIAPVVFLPLPLWGFHQTATAAQDTIQLKYGSVSAAAYTLILMVTFWITEALPLPVTALMPVILYPLFGVLDSEEVTQRYFNDSILIFVGGINLALAFEYSNLHKRIALRVILCFGTSVRKLLLGIVCTTSFLSMWMSNTAVTALMVPIILAVTDELEKCMQDSLNKEFDEKLTAREKQTLESFAASSYDLASVSAPASQSAVAWTLSQRSSIVEGHPLSGKSSGEFKSWKSDVTLSEPGATSRSLSKVLSVTSTLSEGEAEQLQRQASMKSYLANMKIMFLLSISYSSNIGGTAIVTGSGTNIIALGHLNEEHIPEDQHGKFAQVTFLSWFQFNFLITLINVFIAYWFLLIWFILWPKRKPTRVPELELEGATNNKELGKPFVITKEIRMDIKNSLRATYKKMGSISCHEVTVLMVFVLAVVLWIFHDPKVFPGWSNGFRKKFRGKDIDYVSLTTPVIIINLVLFTVPKNREFYAAFFKCNFHEIKYEPLLNWSYAQKKFPWGVIILLGGGFSLSGGVKESGLGGQIGCWLKSLADLPVQVFLLIVCFFASFFTEVASNSAVAQIFIPILRDLAVNNCWHPLVLALPAAVCSSFAFMLPVATPPNAIVLQAANIKITQMAKPGLIMNMLTTSVLFTFAISWGDVVFGFNSYCTPERMNASLARKDEQKC